MSDLFSLMGRPVRLEDLHEQPNDTTVAYARCKRQPDCVYNKLYLGHQRKPEHPDERGALCVIELLVADGERLLIFPIANDTKLVRVETLPAVHR